VKTLIRCYSALVCTAFAVSLTFAACGDDGTTPQGTETDSGVDVDGSDAGVEPDAPGDDGGGIPPGPLPSLADSIDHASLFELDFNFSVDTDRSGQVPGDFDEPVWQIGFTFDSQRYLGQVWEHTATLIIPDTLPAGTSMAAIIPRSTPNPVSEISDNVSYLTQYAAITADRLDIPVLLIDKMPPAVDLSNEPGLTDSQAAHPECFQGLIGNDETLTDCLWLISQESGRSDLFPPLPVATAWVRAVSFLQFVDGRIPDFTLDFEVPEITVDEVVVLGNGLAGFALRYAMALDHRIRGAMVSSADIGGFSSFGDLQVSRWGSDFSFGDPLRQAQFWSSPTGQEFNDLFSFAALSESLADRAYFNTVGTADPRYPLGAQALYAPDLPGDSATTYVAGYGEGFGTLDHLLSWRNLIAHVRDGREWPQISVSTENDAGNVIVTANVTSSESFITNVDLFYVQRHDQFDDLDFRDGIWRTAVMEPRREGQYVGTLVPLADNIALFVRVADAQGVVEGVFTSPIEIVSF